MWRVSSVQMDPKMIDPIKTRDHAFMVATFGFGANEMARPLTSVMPLTETVFDLQPRCCFTMKGVQQDVAAVLQGPYESRPYLPPMPGPPRRYFALCTLRDLNHKISVPMTLTFEGRMRRLRGDARPNPVVSLHKTAELGPVGGGAGGGRGRGGRNALAGVGLQSRDGPSLLDDAGD